MASKRCEASSALLASTDIGDGGRVDLDIWVRNWRVGLQPFDGPYVRVPRIDPLLGETGRKAYPNRDAGRRRHRGRELVGPDGERDEVRRDLWRLPEHGS